MSRTSPPWLYRNSLVKSVALSRFRPSHPYISSCWFTTNTRRACPAQVLSTDKGCWGEGSPPYVIPYRTKYPRMIRVWTYGQEDFRFSGNRAGLRRRVEYSRRIGQINTNIYKQKNVLVLLSKLQGTSSGQLGRSLCTRLQLVRDLHHNGTCNFSYPYNNTCVFNV